MSDQFDDAPDFSIRDLMDTLRRRKWVVIQAFVFVTVIGIVTAVLSAPVFGTAAKLLVTTPSAGALQVVSVDQGNPLSAIQRMRLQQSVETQLEIMRSAEFANRVREKVGGSAMAGVRLGYEAKEKTDIILIQAEGPDAKNAAKVANAAAAAYVDLTLETNGTTIAQLKKWLEGKVATAKRELTKAEDDMLRFKQRTKMLDTSEAATLQLEEAQDARQKARETKSRLISLNSKIQSMKQRIEDLPKTVKELKVGINPEVDAIRNEIAKLKSQRAVLLGTFQPGSARIVDIEEQIRSLEDVQRTMETSVRDEFEKPNPARDILQDQLANYETERDALKLEYAELQGAAEVKTKQTDQVAPWSVEMTRIQRRVDEAQKAYTQFGDQLRDVSTRSVAGSGPTAMLMESAPVPGQPIRPNKPQQIALAMIMGLMLGVGFAFLQEFLDDRVSTSEDVERIAALPTLGAVPTIASEDQRLLIGQDAFSPVTESYRSIRTSVQFSSIDRRIQLLGVTSAHPGEGKSVTAANLAIAMALQGKRVILVDADLRRPTVHRAFRMEAEPGLTSVLAGELSLQEVLRPSGLDGLQILTSGPLPPNPPELLNSQSMLDLMEECKAMADVVIFDTPPVIPVTDAPVLGTHLDGMILVVEAGQARKASVKHARELLDRTRVRILGVVLNKIDQNGKGYYRYSQGGYSGYGYGGYAPLGRQPGQGEAGSVPAGLGAGKESNGSRGLPDRLRDWE